jgi:hypothetical protein
MAQVAGTMWRLGMGGAARGYGGMVPEALEGATLEMLPGGAILTALSVVGVAGTWWGRRRQGDPPSDASDAR